MIANEFDERSILDFLYCAITLDSEINECVKGALSNSYIEMHINDSGRRGGITREAKSALIFLANIFYRADLAWIKITE